MFPLLNFLHVLFVIFWKSSRYFLLKYLLYHFCIRSETTALRIDRDKIALEAEFSKERLNSSMAELDNQVLTIPLFFFHCMRDFVFSCTFLLKSRCNDFS